MMKRLVSHAHAHARAHTLTHTHILNMVGFYISEVGLCSALECLSWLEGINFKMKLALKLNYHQ